MAHVEEQFGKDMRGYLHGCTIKFHFYISGNIMVSQSAGQLIQMLHTAITSTDAHANIVLIENNDNITY